ncbi:hypothetical protein [Aquibacillus kalidii]|uniref:hypothetical protein n=1 Tax=Aquibacillus kalidii TaxID=2762597 RepID=UPI001644AD58|nr:hypothetical protein [Aquibacillus kalidii]
MNRTRTQHQMYELCGKHMHSYVLIETHDGSKLDGIITGVDEHNVYLAIPNHGRTNKNYSDERFGYPGFGYGFGPYPYGPYPGPYPYGSPFRRLVVPLAALTALSLLPWY